MDTPYHLITAPLFDELLTSLREFKRAVPIGEHGPEIDIGNLAFFKPNQVIDFLLSDQKSLFARKQIWFAGLCTWIVCPGNYAMIRWSMLNEAISQLHEEERVAYEHIDDVVTADIFVRLLVIDRRFFEDMYRPLIETSATFVGPIRDLREGIFKESQEIYFSLALLEAMHCHYESIRDNPEFAPLSLGRSYKLVSKRGKLFNVGDKSERRVMDSYFAFRRSAPLAYAAAGIATSKGSLLEQMRAGTASYDAHGNLLPELVGRAAYVRDILKTCHEQRDFETALADLGERESIRIPLELSPDKERAVAEAYRKRPRKS